jgi:CheY-like chemotaxis protein
MHNMKRILIVEDDAKVASALNIRITNAGYETVLAADALSAVAVAVTANPDLILVDINMPAGNGFTVVERIRALVPGRLPVVFITASREPGLADRAIAMGASGFIEKPYNPAGLLALLHNILEKPVQADYPLPPLRRAQPVRYAAMCN